MKRTNRGFVIFTEFTDSYAQEIRVQESSSASGRFCWIFAQKNGESAHLHCGLPTGYAPHLSPAQARKVAKALLKFADGAE